MRTESEKPIPATIWYDCIDQYKNTVCDLRPVANLFNGDDPKVFSSYLREIHYAYTSDLIQAFMHAVENQKPEEEPIYHPDILNAIYYLKQVADAFDKIKPIKI